MAYAVDSTGVNRFWEFIASKEDAFEFINFYLQRKYEDFYDPERLLASRIINGVAQGVNLNPFDPDYEGAGSKDSYANYAYRDLGLPKSGEYLHHLNEFIDFLDSLGVTSEWDGPADEMPETKTEFYNEEWREGGVTYELLKETNDYFWFLVALFQVYCSCHYVPWEDLNDSLMKVDESNLKGFSFDWFTPLKTWVYREKMRIEFENSKKKDFMVDKSVLKSVDFSSLVSVDVNEVPDFELDEYVEHDGLLYDPFDVYLAITAAGGLAQSLERQDLEGSVTNVGKMLKKELKNKKKKPRFKK